MCPLVNTKPVGAVKDQPTAAQYAGNMVEAADMTRAYERDRTFTNEDPLWKKVINAALNILTFGWWEYKESSKLTHNMFQPIKDITQDDKITKKLGFK
jgi:hypothetical protein